VEAMQAIAASAMPSDEVIDVAPAHITTMWSDGAITITPIMGGYNYRWR